MPFAVDPLYKKVALLLRCDGADGSTAFADASLNGLTVTASGGAAVSTAQSKYGQALHLPGGAARLDISGAALANTSQQVCFEAWIYPTSLNSPHVALFDQRTGISGSDRGMLVWISAAGQLNMWFSGTFANIWTAGGAIVANTWTHIACVYEHTGGSNQIYRIYINGEFAASQSFAGSFIDAPATSAKLGCDFANAYPFIGFVDDVRYTVGVPRYANAAPFVPDGPHPSAYGIPGSQTLSHSLGAGGYAPPVGLRAASFARSARDTYFGGRGLLVGTVKEKALPSNLPLRRRTWLIRERDAQIIRETWSHAVTGAYAFSGIDERERYTVMAYDHEHDHRAVVADNLLPELMP